MSCNIDSNRDLFRLNGVNVTEGLYGRGPDGYPQEIYRDLRDMGTVHKQYKGLRKPLLS
ncbi:hypothetical protein M378DRAFT_172301 [Amanita muscaria Koide BX008]|uniref:Uncharacterized protein n=1 Tax=Amanita muscaria (strain Koide BX008) TaxID=946122 RepID=A0A0C2SSA4_AMAMK|nr:hypothetical protein M378DRAFT_172301 [Amanita muscaria Koide BX008]